MSGGGTAPLEADHRPAVLTVKGLRAGYGGRPVLDGLDLEVRAGEVVALVGENGSGKTTLVRCLVGEVPPDGGTIALPGGPGAVGVVWQDLALCDHLDVVANVWLGREPSIIDEAAMEAGTTRLLHRLGIVLPDLRRPVGRLSGGERQLVALARAVSDHPEICIFDEPTAALGIGEARAVEAIVRDLRSAGVAVLIVTHQPDVMAGVADRVVVLRSGRLVSAPSPSELQPDDLLALMTGTEVESTARRQLRHLQTLVSQLDREQPAVALPVVVSAAGAALGQERLCVHLLDEPPDGPPRLRAAAAVGLPEELAALLAELPLGTGGGPVGVAAATATPVVVEDLSATSWSGLAEAAAAAGVVSGWSVPLVGRRGVLGVLSGFDTSTGALSSDRLALVSLYAAQAAAGVERAALLDEVTRRNASLEALRALLESLAGPQGLTDGLGAPLAALCAGVSARTAALYRRLADGVTLVASSAPSPARDHEVLSGAASTLLSGIGDGPSGILRAPGLLAVRFALPEGVGVLGATFDGEPPEGATDVLLDATRSLRLGIEREALETARRESEAARRTARLQREFLARLSHELRTPLTAIRGYASSLLQPDVSFDAATTDRFLTNIAADSERLARLVSDLLDATALESGVLRLVRDWCHLPDVVQAAVKAVPGGERVEVVTGPLPAVWADHDRLCQVLVNLVENALRYSPDGSAVRVTLRPGPERTVELRVADEGPGLAPGVATELFEPWRRGATGTGYGAVSSIGPGAGLGLSIVRGIVEAHGGSVDVETADIPPGEVVGTTFLVRLPVEPADGEPGLWEPVEVDLRSESSRERSV